jgi:hypothetical protein
MRRWYCLAALVVGILAVHASAQTIPLGTSTTNTTSKQAAKPPSRIGPTTYLGSSFRLRDLFRSTSPITNRHHIGSSTIPSPSSPEYLKAFGFKKLY